MPSFLLTSPDGDAHAGAFHLSAADLGPAPDLGQAAWSIRRETLRGGRRDGVDVVTLDNGTLSVAVVPTRGMGLWQGSCAGHRLGWDSPVRDGPVHPQFVRLEDRGGLGWLDGFDEWMVRCGLAHNGPPFTTFDPPDEAARPSARRTMHPLHGRIANIPAHRVSVHVEGDGPDRTLAIEGVVAESTLFHPQLELHTRISTRPGSTCLTVLDTVTNRSDRPGECQLLYHWNFGPPFLGARATFRAPVESLSPRDPRAAEGVAEYAAYGPPEPGFAEQVYLAKLAAGPDGRTLAVLVDPTGAKAVALRYQPGQLPCLTLWKNTGGRADGYVTGLEPATNFPMPLAFERARGRVVPLAPGASFVAETTLEVLATPDAVARAVAEVAAIQSTRPATIHPRPVEPFAPAG